MSIISWNCRGLGLTQDLTINRLMEIRKKYFPELMFLMETMYSRNVLVDIQVWLGYNRVYTINPIGRSGGLAVFWKNSVDVEILSANKNIIDMSVRMGKEIFFVSCIYGEPNEGKRQWVWEKISRIGTQRRGSWCMLGDFNAVCGNHEKIGGPTRSDETFQSFNSMLQSCKMKEPVSQGDPFTWGGRRGKHWIRCKLDRCFGNKEWLQMFPRVSQIFLEKRGSDHRPVLVQFLGNHLGRKGRFRFDKSLLGLPHLKERIVSAWGNQREYLNIRMVERIRRCRTAICNWKKQFDLNAKSKILRIQNDLEKEESSSFPSRVRVHELKQELGKATKEEESFWKQRSKDKWLKCGDRNTKAFHASVQMARSRNGVDILEDTNGCPYRDEETKGQIASSYFQGLFSSTKPTEFGSFFEGFIPKVTDQMNSDLLSVVTDEEIREAVFSIKASSAPGPDGMNALFFQRFWKEIGGQVIKEVHEFFQQGSFDKEWNFTHLCLIPKIVKPVKMTDLRPISLCSVFYKIIAKIMTKRIQPLLSLIVSPNQSAFVSERNISDNILVAHEIVHGLRTFKPVASQFMAIKSDMSKAYDRVEWEYLRAVLLALGFHQKWVELTMFCVSSVSYSVLIIDQPHGLIVPQRGLRQGDPMSPALFVLCAEGLSHLLRKAEEAGRLNGIRFSMQGPSVSHLLFADDSLFMCKANLEQASTLQEILNCYGEATGQVINLQKSSISFGAEIQEEAKAEIRDLMGIYNEGGVGNYLGLPGCFSGSKIELFTFIKEKLKTRLSGWFAKSLSLGGKEVLLKAVALAFPVYAMSCFKLPKTTISNLTSAITNFWWNSVEHKSKIHWVRKESLCLPKDLGGLGFKDLESFNQAMLAKQAWKVLQNPKSLLASVLKSRYYETTDFLEAELGSRPSYGWRSLLHGRKLLRKGLTKEIGNGKSMYVWIDRWCDFGGGRWNPWMKNPIVNLELKVGDLIHQETGEWNREFLEENFFHGDIEIITKLHTAVGCEDYWCWKHNRSGEYTVKSGNWLAMRDNLSMEFQEAEMQPSLNTLKKETWNSLTAPKIQAFMWRTLSNAIPVATSLVTRGMKVELQCPRCGIQDETANHILFTCELARQIWALSNFPSPQDGFHKDSLFVNFSYLFQVSKNIRIPVEIRRCYPWILWLIWKNRNKFVFEAQEQDPVAIVDEIFNESSSWFLAQQLDQQGEQREEEQVRSTRRKWTKPPPNWVKCNYGVKWLKNSQTMGAAWIVRDNAGEALFHSRRSFARVVSLEEAKELALVWTLECMAAHRVGKVIIAGEDAVFMKVIERPKAWPSFTHTYQKMENFLCKFRCWKSKVETRSSNRCAFLIADSASRIRWYQSYVARGGPLWISSLLSYEKV